MTSISSADEVNGQAPGSGAEEDGPVRVGLASGVGSGVLVGSGVILDDDGFPQPRPLGDSQGPIPEDARPSLEDAVGPPPPPVAVPRPPSRLSSKNFTAAMRRAAMKARAVSGFAHVDHVVKLSPTSTTPTAPPNYKPTAQREQRPDLAHVDDFLDGSVVLPPPTRNSAASSSRSSGQSEARGAPISNGDERRERPPGVPPSQVAPPVSRPKTMTNGTRDSLSIVPGTDASPTTAAKRRSSLSQAPAPTPARTLNLSSASNGGKSAVSNEAMMKHIDQQQRQTDKAITNLSGKVANVDSRLSALQDNVGSLHVEVSKIEANVTAGLEAGLQAHSSDIIKTVSAHVGAIVLEARADAQAGVLLPAAGGGTRQQGKRPLQVKRSRLAAEGEQARAVDGSEEEGQERDGDDDEVEENRNANDDMTGTGEDDDGEDRGGEKDGTARRSAIAHTPAAGGGDDVEEASGGDPAATMGRVSSATTGRSRRKNHVSPSEVEAVLDFVHGSDEQGSFSEVFSKEYEVRGAEPAAKHLHARLKDFTKGQLELMLVELTLQRAEQQDDERRQKAVAEQEQQQQREHAQDEQLEGAASSNSKTMDTTSKSAAGNEEVAQLHAEMQTLRDAADEMQEKLHTAEREKANLQDQLAALQLARDGTEGDVVVSAYEMELLLDGVAKVQDVFTDIWRERKMEQDFLATQKLNVEL